MSLTLSPTDERRLATIETITELAAIDGADQIVRARIRGWDVVVKKGEFEVGDPVVYIEIDTLLPVGDERFAFLAPRGVRVQDGIEGHVLKTARMRGVYSQGIAFPVALFPELSGSNVGDDVTGLIAGLTKWDPPLPEELAGSAIGFFPSLFSKTGEERIQNLPGILDVEGVWVATEKLDGSSMSVLLIDGDEHVTSRTIDFLYNPDQPFWAKALELDLFTKMAESFPGKNVAVQGELYGAGMSSNSLRLTDKRFAVFTIQVAEPGGVPTKLSRDSWPDWARKLTVPIHDLPYPRTLDEALAQADGRPSLVPGAKGNIEGLVWRRANGERLPDGSRASFKVLSQRYLMKHDR